METAHEKTNKQLLHILFTKYKLEGHCAHIRKYLLMAQGDLMEYLIDLLADELGWLSSILDSYMTVT